jgi:ADP-ribose pyrophosphatase YjhB (NUDIX family)
MVQTAAAAIIQNKKILLLRRSQSVKRYPGYWTLPGGKAEQDETPEQNAIREVSEETSLVFKPGRLINKPNNPDEGTFIFTGEVSGKIKVQKTEVQEYKWFTYKETLNIEMAFGFKEHLEKLHRLGLI